MRIVAGTCKGRFIDAPSGEHTRPTTDRVREALFSSLYSLRGTFDDAIVLDAFAGSGALGLEALSRGAQFVSFYESDAKAFAVIKANIATCQLKPRQYALTKRDVLAHPPLNQQPPFNLVFFDPPYAYDCAQVLDLARTLIHEGAACPDALFVYEHALSDTDALLQAAQGEVAPAETPSAAQGEVAHTAAPTADQQGRAQQFLVVASKKYGNTAVTILKEGVCDAQ